MNNIDLRKIDLNLLLLFEALMCHGSVSKTADQLGRTQSAVSHALNRLRQQLGDPLLVKGGGRMQPSPYALSLVQEVQPILRSIERVLCPREAFDARISARCFRLAVPDVAMNLFPALMQQQAPQVVIEWETPKLNTLLDTAEGLVDLALLPASLKRPDGVSAQQVGLFQWACFMRQGHPALAGWGAAKWSRWPHVVVGTSDNIASPIVSAADAAKLTRQVGIRVPTFGAVAPLLAKTDLIASLPVVVLAESMTPFQLVAKPLPFDMPKMAHVLVWSSRLTSDPANQWLRQCFTELLQRQLLRADAIAQLV